MAEAVLVMEGKTTGAAALEECLERAAPRAEECNNVLILMQKKEGGLIWAAPDNMELRDLIFMVTSFAYKLSTMAAGE